MKVIFDTACVEYTGVTELDTPTGTASDTISYIFNLFPQFCVAALSGKFLKQLAIVLDDEYLLDYDNSTTPIESIEFVYVPHGRAAEGMTIAETIAVAISAASSIAPATAMIIAEVIVVVAQLAVMIALQFIMGALSGDLSMPDTGSTLNNSATYTWNGIRNTTASGTAIPIVYGTHRIGGMILNVFTRSADSNTAANIGATQVINQTDLYYQLGLCEGPIVSVTSLEINKLPFNFYSEVEWTNMIRLGEESQLVIPQFNEIAESITYSRPITNTNVPILANIYEQVGAYLPVYGLWDQNAGSGGGDGGEQYFTWHNGQGLRLGPYTVESYDQPEVTYGG